MATSGVEAKKKIGKRLQATLAVAQHMADSSIEDVRLSIAEMSTEMKTSVDELLPHVVAVVLKSSSPFVAVVRDQLLDGSRYFKDSGEDNVFHLFHKETDRDMLEEWIPQVYLERTTKPGTGNMYVLVWINDIVVHFSLPVQRNKCLH